MNTRLEPMERATEWPCFSEVIYLRMKATASIRTSLLQFITNRRDEEIKFLRFVEVWPSWKESGMKLTTL
jgi:hypothetical protein